MDIKLMGEEDAIGWLDAISHHLPKNEDTFPFFQALDEIKATIRQCGFRLPKTELRNS